MARITYVGVLAICMVAVVIGLWPSILTLGLLVAVPTAVLAGIGIAKPSTLRARPRALLAIRWGTALLCAELLIIAGWLVWTQRRTVTLIVGEPAPAVIRVVYGVSNGSPRDWWSWNRTFYVPPGGIVHTQYQMDLGWYRPENPHPLRVRQRSDSRGTIPVAGAWVRGGFAKGSNCDVFYDEYVIGLNEVSPSAWLDSLPLWQVECEDGQLLTSLGGTWNLTPPKELCYYNRDGGMQCQIPATAP